MAKQYRIEVVTLAGYEKDVVLSSYADAIEYADRRVSERTTRHVSVYAPNHIYSKPGAAGC